MVTTLPVCLVLLAWFSFTTALGPTYVLQIKIPVNNSDSRRNFNPEFSQFKNFSETEYYEWESFDGWYNNPAHPEWGGAGKFKKKHHTFCIFSFVYCDGYVFALMMPDFGYQICQWKGRLQLHIQMGLMK